MRSNQREIIRKTDNSNAEVIIWQFLKITNMRGRFISNTGCDKNDIVDKFCYLFTYPVFHDDTDRVMAKIPSMYKFGDN